MIVNIKSRQQLAELAPILIKFYSILPYKKNYDNWELNWVDRWIKLIDSGVGGIFGLKDKGEFVGGIGYIIYPQLEDGVLSCSEAFWYVDEKCRGKGLSLLFHLEKFAKSQGVKRFQMIHLENSMPEKLRKVYLRLGFKKIESIYLKEI